MLIPDFTAIPAALTDLKQWVLHKRGGKDLKEKVPFAPDDTPASTTNPATWSTFAEVKATYEKGGFDGIGFVFAGTHYGVDYDHVLDEQGNFKDPAIRDEVAILAQQGAWVERSVSGDGVHMIGIYSGEALSGKKEGCREAYVTGRYFTITGQAVREIARHKNLQFDTTPAFLAWHKQHFKNSTPTKEKDPKARIPIEGIDSNRAEKHARHYLLHEAPPAISGSGGNNTTYQVACVVKDKGIPSALDCLALMSDYYNSRCEPPWSEDELRTIVEDAYRYGKNRPGVATPEADFDSESVPKGESIGKDAAAGGDGAPTTASSELTKHPYEKLNDQYAHVMAGGKAHILQETTDAYGRYKLKHLDINSFHSLFAPQKMMVGKVEKSVSKWWLEWKGRRSYEDLVFMPEQQAPERFYNLWKGFAYQPAPLDLGHSAVDAFLEHVQVNVCQKSPTLTRWLLGFFAHLVQRPWEKPLVALVFKGAKGVGKNALIERVGALLGGHFFLTSKKRYLSGHFTGHLENCLMIAFDEAFWSGDREAESALKDLITGTEHVIEHKGCESYTVANKTRVVILGNADWLVPSSHDERRFAIFEVGEGRKQDGVFFQKMREGMEAGGYAHLLRYLLDYDLTGIDLNRAPSTKGLLEQKLSSLDSFGQWWFACLQEGTILCAEFAEWPAEMECERFRAAFRRYHKERRMTGWIMNEDAIGKALKKFAPSIVKKRMSKRDEGRLYVYFIPELKQARAEWDKYIQDSVEWGE